MPKNPQPPADEPAPPAGEIVLYQTEDGRTRVECRFVDETLWLSQALIAELFQVTVATVNEHLKNIIAEGEVQPGPTIRKFRIVRREGSRDVEREIEHYNLDAILAVGYRVRSERGTQFRRWATERLSEYLVKGFTMDDQRLKNPPIEGLGVPDYFDELLERIRDIRASEKRMYLRVREIFALAGDYDPGRRETTEFFQIIQNRLHFAATGKTAPELIAGRADHSKPNMGLTAWKGDVVRKADVTVAKNYLSQEEIGELNRIVTMWLDFAEDQARRRKQVFLKDWEAKLNDFLRFNERAVLGDKGSVSKTTADTPRKPNTRSLPSGAVRYWKRRERGNSRGPWKMRHGSCPRDRSATRSGRITSRPGPGGPPEAEETAEAPRPCARLRSRSPMRGAWRP